MNANINARDIKDHVSLVDLLSRLGYQPHRKSGQEHIYWSMLRDSDTTPSFSVNDKLGCWYDHGEGKGGNIIDFGLLYWKGSSFQEVLEKISNIMGAALPVQSNTDKAKRKRSAIKEPHYKVLEVKDLGLNTAITNYLQSRGIWLKAQGRLKEVYYYVEDDKRNRKHFFGAGWQNELGAWEVRSVNFKGCLGHKAISFIPGNPDKLAVFEGFINYLSWLSENTFADESVLVLNSIALIQSGIRKAKDFNDISLYFDNDTTGRKATVTFQQALRQSVDCSPVYEGHNDYNDKLIAGLNGNHFSR
ncbi:toprim domain-containing protein [Mucilaginibacter gotjawali]|uniref:DNA primase n=2 Tax=Mucilaginibacter gotjawali TaxID=1550579 RepID=A0A0X8X4Q0_9SPHI|nr:toprim domain-containing protein [Mucilaginibacter gotjawali]MBB3058258.1 hypothetical protein [Mucilaginibacter gotjawali]BAU55624.1 DNA primase [Mucilaginibacter gotjawali]